MSWGAAIGGGLGAIGSIVGSSISSSSSKKAMKMQIAWERERAKNSYQWAMEDMKKAGLNPILGMAQNGGSQTGGISAITPDTSGYSSAGQILSQTAGQLIQNKSVESQKELNSADATLKQAEAANELAKNPYIPQKEKAEIAKINAETQGKTIENKFQKETYYDRLDQLIANVDKDISESRISRDNAQMLEKIGITREEAVKLGTEGIKIIIDAVKSGVGLGMVSQIKNKIISGKKMQRHSAK